MEDLLRIAKEAEKILDVVIAVFQENDVPLPERRFLAIGETSHDCEQLSVSFTSVGVGMPGDDFPPMQSCTTTAYNATFNIEIVRCTPVGKKTSGGAKYTPPTAVQLQDYGVPRLVDSWLLVKAAQRYNEFSYAKNSRYSVVAGEEQGGVQPIILTLTSLV